MSRPLPCVTSATCMGCWNGVAVIAVRNAFFAGTVTPAAERGSIGRRSPANVCWCRNIIPIRWRHEVGMIDQVQRRTPKQRSPARLFEPTPPQLAEVPCLGVPLLPAITSHLCPAGSCLDRFRTPALTARPARAGIRKPSPFRSSDRLDQHLRTGRSRAPACLPRLELDDQPSSRTTSLQPTMGVGRPFRRIDLRHAKRDFAGLDLLPKPIELLELLRVGTHKG